MRRAASVRVVSCLAILLTLCLVAPSLAAPPSGAGTKLQVPLFRGNGATLPPENEVCWVTNVCGAPVEAQIALDDAQGNSLGNTVTRELAPWQSYDCNVVSQLGLASDATQDGTLDASAPSVRGESCLVADSCRLDGSTLACAQLWVTGGAHPMGACQDYIAHFVETAFTHFDLKSFHQSGSSAPVQVDVFDQDGNFAGGVALPGNALAQRVSVKEILSSLGSPPSEGNLYIHLPMPGEAEVEVYSQDGTRRSRIPAWCLSKSQVPCTTFRDDCGVCGGDGSSCGSGDGGGSGGTGGTGGAQLSCSPLSQTVATGVDASLTAIGGSGDYAWTAPGGTPGNGAGPTFTVQYAGVGHQTVTVSDSGQTARCEVEVIAPPGGGGDGGDGGGGDDGGGGGGDNGGTGHKPPACHLTLSPSTVVEGASTVLHWAISGAPPGDFGSLVLREGTSDLGSVSDRTGKMPVTPHGAAGSTVTYYGTVLAHDGTSESSCSRTIRIVAPHGHR